MPRRPLVLALLGLLGFLVLAGLVLAHKAPLPLDGWLHRLAVAHRGPVVGTATAVTMLGTVPVVLPLLLLAGVVAARRSGRWVLVLAGPVLLFVGQAVRYTAMVVVDRPRPPMADWSRFASGQSFPSGHTTTSALGYGLMLLLVAASVRSRPGRAAVAVVLLGVAVLVGVSRVVLGVHWPTDVLGGWSLSLFLGGLSAVALRAVEDGRRPRGPRRAGPAEGDGAADERAVDVSPA